MKHLKLPQALGLALLSLCLSSPLGAWAQTPKESPSLQCERDGKLQSCDDQPKVAKPKKAAAFKAQASEMTADTQQPTKKKKKKKSKKAAQKKAPPSAAE